MASIGLQSFSRSLGVLRGAVLNSKDPLTQCLAPQLARGMATETSMPSSVNKKTGIIENATPETYTLPSPTVLTTIYKFPAMEPVRFESYSSKHLHLPLRRDLLHRAVVFEGDFTRQGTASTKTRWEVHGSHAKIRPQKGTGRARLGTKQSPMLRGGGKSFGPHPRDFATQLPRKMYDLAWRTALSYRYRKGDLIVCQDGMEIEYPEGRYVKDIFEHLRWGKQHGRTLVITNDFTQNLSWALDEAPEDGRVLMREEVDVKDLLETGRVVIEKKALDKMLGEHSSDLHMKIKKAV